MCGALSDQSASSCHSVGLSIIYLCDIQHMHHPGYPASAPKNRKGLVFVGQIVSSRNAVKFLNKIDHIYDCQHRKSVQGIEPST